MSDDSAPASDDPFNRQATLRIMRQSVFRHFLLNFKTSGLFISVFWNRLVYVSSHMTQNFVALPAMLQD